MATKNQEENNQSEKVLIPQEEYQSLLNQLVHQENLEKLKDEPTFRLLLLNQLQGIRESVDDLKKSLTSLTKIQASAHDIEVKE